MNHRRLDSIGIAGFGHDFKSIDGEMSPVVEAFAAFGEANPDILSILSALLGTVIPQVINIPVKRTRLFTKLNEVTSEIANELFENSRREKGGSGASSDIKDRSIIGLLGKYMSFGPYTTLTFVSERRIFRFRSEIIAG